MAEASQKDLAVVIVGWNVKDLVLQNLAALDAAIGRQRFQVCVVDNASSDGTVDAVRSAFPDVTVIANAENLGFAKACNQGIEYAIRNTQFAIRPHVLLLNPDMRVEPDALEKTIAYLDAHPEVAVLGARLIGSDGKPLPHVRRFPTLSDQLAILCKVPHLFPHAIDRYLAKDLDLEKEQQVDSVRGSYFAINRTALDRLGGLDERYFLWFEEVDYCKQVAAAHMKVMYVPSIVAHDLVGRSFAQRTWWWKQRVFFRSMVTYFKKWGWM